MTLEILVELFEALTILCFGISWPVSIRKSLKSRTAKGKSLSFELFILAGYAIGIARKIIQVSALGQPTAEGLGAFIFFLGFFFYVFNFVAISIDVALYFRNTKLDKLAEENKQ